MALSPQNKKYLTYAACGVGVVVLLKLILPKTDSSGAASDPTNNGMPGGTVPSTFNPSIVAEKLYDAMKEWGTDEAAIFNALQPVNQAMFAQVYGKFGNRSYNTSQGNQVALPFFPLPLHNLKTWLRNELNDENYNTLRLKYPQYL